MKITKYTFQMGSDFAAILTCEHCSSTQELKTGYDDGFYHNHVLPSIKCRACGKDRNGRLEGSDTGVNLPVSA